MAKSNLAAGESFTIYTRIEQTRRYVDVVRFTAGEIAIPEGSKLTQIQIWSGPAQCDDSKQFSPKFESGRPVVVEVAQGQSVPLPASFFQGHAVALVGNEVGAITLRLRG